MKTPCKFPGCRALLDKAGWCEAHAHKAPNHDKQYDRHTRYRNEGTRTAAQLRNSAAWRKVRKTKLGINPLCEDPFGTHAQAGNTATAQQVHHIMPIATHRHLATDLANLMSVCTRCHARLEANGTQLPETGCDAAQANLTQKKGISGFFG